MIADTREIGTSKELMSDEPDIFAQRLLSAFLHLSPNQQQVIQDQMTERGIKGGLKTGIAKLAGIRTPSLLSDMLAGRLRGERYRGKIAELLGVDENWLLGLEGNAPDWALLPGEAYQRMCRRWRRAFGQLRGTPTVDPMDSINEEDDSSSNRMWMAWLRDDERRFHAEAQDRQSLAEAFNLDPDGRDADWLAAGRYERCSFELLRKFHVWLELPKMNHPDVVRAGHRAVQVALAHQEWLTATVEARIERYSLPESLFDAARKAIREQRLLGIEKGINTQPLEDALELIWRQQLRRAYGFKRPPVPSGFTEDTGRITWSEARIIQQRARAQNLPRG